MQERVGELVPFFFFNNMTHQDMILGWVWYLTPLIPALWEAKTEGSLEVRSLGPAWETQQDPIFTKIFKVKKISLAWWCALPATWEAEVGRSLEPKRLRLQS